MAIVPINSKQKGARFERQLASRLREYGYPARRTAQYCGNTGDASDVDCAGTERLPAVFHKRNNHEILVTLELPDFMEIYREYEVGMDLKGKETP